MKKATRIECIWSVEKRIAIHYAKGYLGVPVCSRDWSDFVLPDGEWKPEYASATVAALFEGVWPRDFKEKVTKDVQFRRLQADPDRGFALMKAMTERRKILEEEVEATEGEKR